MHPEKIKTIRSIGLHQTINIEIDSEDHLYLANGIVNQNSHSVVYALTAYQTMYAKVHFPTEFYCAWLSFAKEKPDPKEEIYNLVQDAKRRNIKILPPSLKHCNIDFEIVKDREILFGISDIRGVGVKAVENVQKFKDKLQTFQGFLTLAKKIKRNVCEALIKSGACDFYGLNRNLMLRYLWCLMGRSDNENEGYIHEFKKLTPNELDFVIERLAEVDIKQALTDLLNSKKSQKKRKETIERKIRWLDHPIKENNKQRSIWEKIYLGLNLSCSAADDVIKDEESSSVREFYLLKPKENLKLYAVIDDIQYKKTSEKAKEPNRDYCYLNISDNSGAINCAIVWPDLFEREKANLFENTVVKIFGKKDNWGGKDQLVVHKLEVIG